jgi:hypothetical protein
MKMTEKFIWAAALLVLLTLIFGNAPQSFSGPSKASAQLGAP